MQDETGNMAGMNDEQLADLVLDAGISIDGSWNKRGWSARDGVVAVISTNTGKVLDVVFLSNSCMTCEQMKRKQKDGAISRIDYLSWVVSHDENCFHNHEGSSQVYLFLFNSSVWNFNIHWLILQILLAVYSKLGDCVYSKQHNVRQCSTTVRQHLLYHN